MWLSDLSVGDSAAVNGFSEHTAEEARTRFRALGFVAGSVLIVDRRLPFGGPIIVRLGGAAFALDYAAACQLDVAPIGDE